MPYANPEVQREYQRQWMADRRAAWLAENGPCKRCGSSDGLEVDHIDRTQKVAHKVWSWSQVRRDAELAKCQVLCHPCHLAKSQEAGDIPIGQHGRKRMYNGGCRCAECRAWRSRKAAREWAQTKARRTE